MRIRTASALFAITLAAGCSPPPHVKLVAPSPSATEAERIAAYERLFARGDALTATVQHGQITSVSRNYIILGDGTRVAHADDLLPVVAPDSPTATHAKLSREALDRGVPLMKAGWIVAAASIVGGVALGFIAGPDSDAFPIGIGIALVGAPVGIGMTFVGVQRGRDFGPERDSAFATYDKDLLAHLDLCRTADKLAACAAAAPATAAPAPTAPVPDAPAAAPAAAPAPATPAAPAAPPAAPAAATPTPAPASAATPSAPSASAPAASPSPSPAPAATKAATSPAATKAPLRP